MNTTMFSDYKEIAPFTAVSPANAHTGPYGAPLFIAPANFSDVMETQEAK